MSENHEALREEIDERDVVAYLQQHPDFFTRHETLLMKLSLPHPQNGQAISLVERQLSVMRSQKQQLRDQLHQLTLAARTNEQLMSRFQHLILNLIDSDSLEGAINNIRDALHEDFHADAVEVLLFRDSAGGTVIDPADSRLQPFALLLEQRTTLCGRLRQEQFEVLFGEAAKDLASAVVVPLCEGQYGPCLGLLGIGSIDPERYHPQMGTMFVNHLGAVMNRIFRTHLEP